ncbi:hypothetical protein CerSpe_272110 [Prunus speciosa]
MTSPPENPDVTMTPVEEEVPQQNQNLDSESHSQSKTLTLEPTRDPEIQQNPLQLDANKPKPEEFPVRSPRSTTITFYRRTGTKRKKLGQKRRAAVAGKKSEQKLQIQKESLNPIPFVPVKSLDFEKHEKLLKWLNLWDFVHIDFDRTIRVDLLAELISHFNPNMRGSYVNGVKIMVNRADLARALKLPVKKSAVADGAEEPPAASEESIAFIEEFVSNWVLLHEDTWMMPSEVLNWTKAIKEGHFGKVDWAGLIWFMVEKELAQAPKLGDCYYASHLQCLIKSQREELLMVKAQEPTVHVDVDLDLDADVDVDVDAKEEEEEDEEDGNGDVKMGGENGVKGFGLEEKNIELCLGQESVDRADVGQDNVERTDVGQDNLEKDDVGRDNVERDDVGQENLEFSVEKEHVGVEDAMNFEECKVEEHGQWLLDGKSNVSEPCLQRCNNLGEVKSLGFGEEGQKGMEVGGVEEEGNEEEEEGEEEEEEGGFHLSLKGMPLEGLPSGSLIQAMEAAQIPLSSGMSMRDHFSGEFVSSRDDSRMLPGSSSLFGSGLKRELIHENANSHHPLNGNKRLRIDGPWDGKLSGEFETCMEQMQHWMEKARMVYVEKEQACEESTVHQQMLMDGLQQRDDMIDHLHKAKAEEHQKREVEVYRLERELYVMGNLLDGYRKALKETQKAFAEYRARCPQADEPLYRDVPGSGGLVLSTMELEKQRLKKEEEERMNRQLIEKKIRDFEAGWISNFEAHHKNVELLSNRLLDVENEVKLLHERLAKQRTAKVTESAPNDTE